MRVIIQKNMLWLYLGKTLEENRNTLYKGTIDIWFEGLLLFSFLVIEIV